MAVSRASELPPETLAAGDVIEYYSTLYVHGDERGYRKAIVLRVDSSEPDYPIRVSSGEVMPQWIQVHKIGSHTGGGRSEWWRKLKTLRLVDSSFSAPTSADALNQNLSTIVEESISAIANSARPPRRSLRLREQPPSSEAVAVEPPERQSPTTPPPPPRMKRSLRLLAPAEISAATIATPTIKHSKAADTNVIVLISDDEDAADKKDGVVGTKEIGEMHQHPGVATEVEDMQPTTVINVREALDFISSVQTPAERAKKHRRLHSKHDGGWFRRSRRSKHKTLCGPVTDGHNIYHATTHRAKQVHEFLKIAGVREALQQLRTSRKLALATQHKQPPSFDEEKAAEPTLPERGLWELLGDCEPVSSAWSQLDWPVEVRRLYDQLNPNAVTFPDAGDTWPCNCIDDCYRDECENASSYIYCTQANCNLGAKCGNSVRENPGLLLVASEFGASLITTSPLYVGQIIGEYCGELSAFEGVKKDKSNVASVPIKTNSGYTMELN